MRVYGEYQDAIPSLFTDSKLSLCLNLCLIMWFSLGVGIFGAEGDFVFLNVVCFSWEKKFPILTCNFNLREATSAASTL